jgi:hypothetical protein
MTTAKAAGAKVSEGAICTLHHEKAKGKAGRWWVHRTFAVSGSRGVAVSPSATVADRSSAAR